MTRSILVTFIWVALDIRSRSKIGNVNWNASENKNNNIARVRSLVYFSLFFFFENYSIYFSFKSEYLGYAYVRVSRQDCLILWWPFNSLHIVIRADGSDTTMSDEGRSRALDPWKLTLFSLVNLKQYHS